MVRIVADTSTLYSTSQAREAGFAVSALVSFGALSLLMKLIRKGKLAWFSWYLYSIGIAVIIWQITQR